MGQPEVLVVDDEPAIRRALERALRLEGFSVRTAAGGKAALEAIAEAEPDVIVLDIAMPDLDGVTVTGRLRADGVDVPICVVSARDEVDDRVAGLQAGADDYVVKPFALPELVARLHALLRRRPEPPSVPILIGDIHIDPARRQVRRGTRPIELTRREFDLLETFARHPGLVLTRAQLLTTVWGYDFEVDSNVVDVFVGYLRRKLETDGQPRLLHTVRGVGSRSGPRHEAQPPRPHRSRRGGHPGRGQCGDRGPAGHPHRKGPAGDPRRTSRGAGGHGGQHRGVAGTDADRAQPRKLRARPRHQRHPRPRRQPSHPRVRRCPACRIPEPRPDGYATVRVGGAEWRTLTRPLSVVDPPEGTPAELRMQVARPLAPVEATVDSVRGRVVVLGAIGLVVTAVLAWLVTGLALRPLGRLRAAAANVASTDDLAMRVPADAGPIEVDVVAESLNAMLARLQTSVAATEAALDASRGFAANAAHELRTPLTSIQANLDALSRNPELPDEQRHETLHDINAELARLVALLEALRTLARGEASEGLPTERLDFADLVDAAVQGTRRRHPDAVLTFDDPGGEATVEGWAEGLELLVANVLENAATHGKTGAGHTVHVRATVEPNGRELRFVVDDDGPGIPYAERSHVLERFGRGTGAQGTGFGLGLALVAQQVELHRGTVAITESPTGGARVDIRLPAPPDLAPSDSVATGPTTRQPGTRAVFSGPVRPRGSR